MFSILLALSSFASATETCRPSLSLAIERAQQRCTVWGCKGAIERTAAIMAQYPDLSAAEIMAKVRRWNYGGDTGSAALLLTELGWIDANRR